MIMAFHVQKCCFDKRIFKTSPYHGRGTASSSHTLQAPPARSLCTPPPGWKSWLHKLLSLPLMCKKCRFEGLPTMGGGQLTSPLQLNSFTRFYSKVWYKNQYIHRRTGPVSFRGGGGGAEVSCPHILSIACPKNQVVLPEFYMIFFLPENGYMKNSRGLQPPSPPPASYAYEYIHDDCMWLEFLLIRFGLLIDLCTF